MSGELELLPNTRQVRDFYCHARQSVTQRWRDHSFEAEFDAWLAAHDAEIAAKAWGEGWSTRASRGYAHLKVGECVPPPAHINPYREAVQP